MTSPPSKTIVITGISSHSPLSTNIIAHILTHSTTQHLTIALLGPSLPYLTETASTLRSLPNKRTTTTITPFEVDLKSAQSIGIVAHSIRAQLGAADILIHNAPAHLPAPSIAAGTLTPVRGADEDEWWEVLEVNVRSIQFIARHFFTKMKEGGVFVNVVGGRVDEMDVEKGMSAWDASGVAAERAVRYLGAENKQFRCLSVYVSQDGVLSEEVWNERVGKVVGLLEV